MLLELKILSQIDYNISSICRITSSGNPAETSPLMTHIGLTCAPFRVIMMPEKIQRSFVIIIEVLRGRLARRQSGRQTYPSAYTAQN
jgi:hypothetical protein